jgi:hypothetical protein
MNHKKASHAEASYEQFEAEFKFRTFQVMYHLI